MWSSFRRVILFEVIATAVPFEAEIMSALVTNTAGSVRKKKRKKEKSNKNKNEKKKHNTHTQKKTEPARFSTSKAVSVAGAGWNKQVPL